MSRFKAFALASCVGLLGAALAPNTARLMSGISEPFLTVNEPIQVPNATLQPGKYVMKLLDSPSNQAYRPDLRFWRAAPHYHSSGYSELSAATDRAAPSSVSGKHLRDSRKL